MMGFEVGDHSFEPGLGARVDLKVQGDWGETENLTGSQGAL